MPSFNTGAQAMLPDPQFPPQDIVSVRGLLLLVITQSALVWAAAPTCGSAGVHSGMYRLPKTVLVIRSRTQVAYAELLAAMRPYFIAVSSAGRTPGPQLLSYLNPPARYD